MNERWIDRNGLKYIMLNMTCPWRSGGVRLEWVFRLHLLRPCLPVRQAAQLE